MNKGTGKAKQMRRAFVTVCTADHFQHYIPLYLYCLRNYGADVHVFVRGEIDDMTNAALDVIGLYIHCIVEGIFLGYPFDVSTTNCLRFIVDTPVLRGYDYLMITDIDLLLFEDPFPWHINGLTDQPFCGHHGPYKFPKRPGISPWVGDMERVAGGFLLVTKDWWKKTDAARKEYGKQLFEVDTKFGTYRESDEVMLARIIKDSGMSVPESKYFPPSLRGVHLGDFKSSMSHRWQNPQKMASKLTIENCFKYQNMTMDDRWRAMVGCLAGDGVLMQILENVDIHIKSRGMS